MHKKKHVLHFFMTHGLSLKKWKDHFIIARELDYFREVLKQAPNTHIFLYSYASNLSAEISILKDYNLENIVPVRLKTHILPYNLYQFLSNIKYSDECIIRTNQTQGSFLALICSFFLPNAKFIYRTGYCQSSFQKNKCRKFRYYYYRIIEVVCAYFCSLRVTSSSSQCDHLLCGKKINVIELPNYIPGYFFNNSPKKNTHFVYYGRLSNQKQIYEICDAFKELTQLTLHIYGTGPEENKVKKAFSCCKNILFYPPIQNDKLCEVISCYRFGLLLSKYEGMPKVAIEMMSMGLVLIATPVGNLNQILVHQENSIIAPHDSSKWKELLIDAKSLSENHLTKISKTAYSDAMKYHTSNIISKEINFW